MSRDIQKVTYGYEPPEEKQKGTLIFYDAFEQVTDQDLDLTVEVAESLSFAKLVLYPLHEQTVKRMSKEPVSSFYKREDRLHEWKRDRGRSIAVIESWEGKRKKYTPMDYALRHLTEKYSGPHFLYVTPETANQFASYTSFKEWIVKIRLILSSEPRLLHPLLEKYRHRWQVADH
ncbi:hypothetical protein [Paenibacillus abyssi]|uniref:Uncharacterized protein n=1 Tax=Paenibacillus abyssi TaxID=1340531 RepID=A0A917LCM6_9BACL|nr:hypothetical protein [Paenibacillus abyssi]GGG14259.1 hypothetical protein GCM10010916_33940 [Paenibacillus abyssi]